MQTLPGGYSATSSPGRFSLKVGRALFPPFPLLGKIALGTRLGIQVYY